MLGQITLHGILTCVIAVIIFIFQSLNYLVTELKKYVARNEHGEKITSIVIADTTISSDLKPNNNALENCIIAQDLIQKHFDIPLLVAENESKVDDLIKNTQTLITRKENNEFVDHLIDNSYIARGLGLIAATVGRETEFYLYSRYSNSFENIVVELKGRNGESGKLTISKRNSISSIELTSIPISYIYDEDRIKVTYIPLTEGVHTLTLIQNGLSICRSPYYVSVDKSPTNSRSRIRLGTKKYRMAMKSDKGNYRNIETKDKIINNINHTIESSKTTVKQDILPASKENCTGTDVMSIVTKFESKSSGVRKKIQKRMISITERSHEYDLNDGNSTSLDVKPEIETHRNYEKNNVNINHENDKLNYKNIIDINNYNKQNKFTIKPKENNEIINDITQTENVLPTLPKHMSSVIVHGKDNENSNIIGDYSQIFKFNEPLGQNINEISIESVKVLPEIYSTNSEQCTANENFYFDEDKKTEILMENIKNLELNTNDCIDKKNTDSVLNNIDFPIESIIASITKPNRVCEKCSKELLEILSVVPRNINIIQHANSNDNCPKIENILEQPNKENNGFENIIKNMNEYKNEYFENGNSANSKSSITIIDKHIKCHLQNQTELSNYNSDELCNNTNNSKSTEVIINTNEYNDDKIIVENIPNTITSTCIKQSLKVDESKYQEYSISTNTDPIYDSANKIEQTQNLENPTNHNTNILKSNQCNENINTNLKHNCKECDLTLSMHNSSIINKIEKQNETLDTNELKLINKVLSSFNVPVPETTECEELYHESQINNICETDEQTIILSSNQDINQKLMIEKLIEPVLNSFKINMVEQIVQLYLNKNLSNQNNIQLLENNYTTPFNELHEFPSNNHTNNAQLKHENKNGENEINEISTSLVDNKSLNNVKHIIKSNITQNDVGSICETEIYSNSNQYNMVNCDKNIEQINCIQSKILETSITNNTKEIAKDKQKDEKFEKINNVKMCTDKLEKISDIGKVDHVPASKLERIAETEKIIESNLEKEETKYKTPKPCDIILVENIKAIELNTTCNTSISNSSETGKIEESIKEEIEILHFKKPDDAQTSIIELKTTPKSNVVNVSEITTINKPNVRGIETTTEITEYENTASVKKPSIIPNDSRELGASNKVDLKNKTFTIISNNNDYIAVDKNTIREKEINKVDGEKSVIDKITELKLQPINLTDIVVTEKFTSEDIKTKPHKLLSNNPTIVNIEIKTTDTQSLSNTTVIVSVEQPNTITIQNKSDIPVLSLNKNVLTTESKSKKQDFEKQTTNIQEPCGLNVVMEPTRLQDEHKYILHKNYTETTPEKNLEDNLDLLIIKEPIKTKTDIETIDPLSDDIPSVNDVKEHEIDYDSINTISKINEAHSDLLDKNSEIEHTSEPKINKCNFITNEDTIKVKTEKETEQTLSNDASLKSVENVSENNIDTIHGNLVKNEAQSESINTNNERKLEHTSKSLLDNNDLVTNDESIKDKTVDPLSNDKDLLAVVHTSEIDMENVRVELQITSKIIKDNSFGESINVTMLTETEDRLLKEKNDNKIETDTAAMHINPVVLVENTSEVDVDTTHEDGTLIVCPSEILVKHNNQVESENELNILDDNTDLVDIKEFIKAKVDIKTVDPLSNDIPLETIIYQIKKAIETNNDAHFTICSQSESKDELIKSEKGSEINIINTDKINKNIFKHKSDMSTQHQLIKEESELLDIHSESQTIKSLESIIDHNQFLPNKEHIKGNTDNIIPVSVLADNDHIMSLESPSKIDIYTKHNTLVINEVQSISINDRQNIESENISKNIQEDEIELVNNDESIKDKIDITIVDPLSNDTTLLAVINSSEADPENAQVELQTTSEIIEDNNIKESIIGKIMTGKVDQLFSEKVEEQNETEIDAINTTHLVTVENNSEITIDTKHETHVKNYSQPELIDELPKINISSEVIITNTDLVPNKNPITANTNMVSEISLPDVNPLIPVENKSDVGINNVYKVGKCTDCPFESLVNKHNQIESEKLKNDTSLDDIEESIEAKTDIEEVDSLSNEVPSVMIVNEHKVDNTNIHEISVIIESHSTLLDKNAELITKDAKDDTDMTIEHVLSNNTSFKPVQNESEIVVDTTPGTLAKIEAQTKSINTYNEIKLKSTSISILDGEALVTTNETVKDIIDTETADTLSNENNSPLTASVMNISDTDINNAHMELERTLEILEDIYIEESNNAKMIIGTDDDEEKIKNLNETIHKTSFIPVENTSEITIDTLHETHITNHSQSDSIDEISKTEISTELIIVNIDLVTNENPITSITDLTPDTPSLNDSTSVSGENTSKVDMDNMHGIGTFIDYPSELLVNHNKLESETEVMALEDHTRLDDNEEKIKPKIDIKTVYPPTNDISFEGISNQIEIYKDPQLETKFIICSNQELIEEPSKSNIKSETDLNNTYIIPTIPLLNNDHLRMANISEFVIDITQNTLILNENQSVSSNESVELKTISDKFLENNSNLECIEEPIKNKTDASKMNLLSNNIPLVPVVHKTKINNNYTHTSLVMNDGHLELCDKNAVSEITSNLIINNNNNATNVETINSNTLIVVDNQYLNYVELVPIENTADTDMDEAQEVLLKLDCLSESVDKCNEVESETQFEVLESDTVQGDIDELIRTNTNIGTGELLSNENDSSLVVTVINSSEADPENAQVELQTTSEIIEDNSMKESIIGKIMTGKVDQLFSEKVEEQNETEIDAINTTHLVTVENNSEMTIDTKHETHVTNYSQPELIDELPKINISSEVIITNTDLVTNKNPITANTNMVSEISLPDVNPLIPVENKSDVGINNVYKVGKCTDCSFESLVNKHNQIESEKLKNDTSLDDIEESIEAKTDIEEVDSLSNEVPSVLIVNEHKVDNTNIHEISVIIESHSTLLDKNAELITKDAKDDTDMTIEHVLSNDTSFKPVQNESEIVVDTTPGTLAKIEAQTKSINTNNEIKLKSTSISVLDGEALVTINETVKDIIDTETADTLSNENNSPLTASVMNISDTDINNAHMELERTSEILEDNFNEESNNAKMMTGTYDNEEKIINLNETLHKTSFIPVENTSEITIDTLHETHITNHSQSDSIDEISKTEISTELIIVNIDLETNENPITSITDLTSETSSSNDSPSVPGENTSNVDMDNMHGIGTFIDYSSELLGNHNKIESETEVMTLEDHTRLDDNEEKIKPKIDIKTVYPPTNDISFEGISNQIENYKNTEHETGNDDTAYTSLVMNEVQSELLDKYQDSEIETSKILGCNTDNKSNEEPTQNKIDSLSEMLLSNESRIPIEENKREIDTDATPDTIVINKIQSESLTLNKEVELQFLSEDQLTIDDYLIPVQNTSTMIINIDTVYETQVTVCSQSESVDELEKTDISFESNIYNTDLVTNEENENIDDNTNMTTECSVSNDAFLKSVINTSDIDINIKHEHLVLNDSPAEEIKDLEIQRICGIENLNILIPETNISNGNSILKETTEQKVPIDVDTKTDIPTEDISLNKNPLLPVQKTMEIDILQQTMHTETEIPIDIPLPNDALAVTVENSSEFNRVTTEELLLSTNSSLTCILNNTGSKSKNKLNDIVTTEEIENSEVKNKNAQPNLFCDTVDTNDVDILNNIPKHRKASDEFQLSSDHNLRVKSCDIPESELSVQDVETYATDSFEETFVQSEQTSRNKISMNTVDNENKTTIDDKLYTVNESDLNAILCASSLQEALTLLDSKIKLKFKNNTKKVSSKVKTATYDSSMQLPSSSNSENNFNFTEARDFFKQIEQKSKNN